MRNIMLHFNQHIDFEWPDFVTPNNGVSNDSVLIIASLRDVEIILQLVLSECDKTALVMWTQHWLR